MEPVRFGIIGCGQVGQWLDGGDYNGVAWWQANAVKNVPEVKIVACSSRKEENREAFAKEFGGAPYADYHDMLASDEVDVVSICTPSGTHADIAIEAAKAGKHVITEKPMDVKLDKADAMIQACRDAGVKLQVVFPRRVAPGIPEAKKALEEGAIGTLVLAAARCQRWRKQDYFADSSWRGTWWGDGGGAMMNQGIHIIDLLVYLMGDVESVIAKYDTLGHEIEVEDVAVVLLKFQNGAYGTIYATTCAYPDLHDGLEINGMTGTFRFGSGVDKIWQTEGPEPEAGEKPKYTGHAAIFYDMVQAVREDRDVRIPGEEGRKALEVILAAYQSAREGREIQLPLT